MDHRCAGWAPGGWQLAYFQSAAVGEHERRLWLRVHVYASWRQQTKSRSTGDQKFTRTDACAMPSGSLAEEMETSVKRKAASPVSASMTPCAKLSSSVSGGLPKPRETLVAMFVVLLEVFWLKRMVGLLSKAHLTEVFAHENAQMKGE